MSQQPPQYPQPYSYRPQPPKKPGFDIKKVPWWGWVIGVFAVIVVIGASSKAGVKVSPTPTPQAVALAAPSPTIQPTTVAPTAKPEKPTTTPKPSPTDRPTATATAVPTATPIPTATPLPTATPAPTPTPDYKALLDKQPPAVNYTGDSDKVVKGVQLSKGAPKVTFHHNGSGYFGIKLLDAEGNNIDLVANAIGPVTGSKFIPIDTDGQYVFEVQADAAWAIEVEDSNRALLDALVNVQPGPVYKGKDSTALVITINSSGLNVFKSTITSKDYFGAKLISVEDGSELALLANDIGPKTTEKSLKIDTGIYLVNIEATGDWTFEIE